MKKSDSWKKLEFKTVTATLRGNIVEATIFKKYLFLFSFLCITYFVLQIGDIAP